MALKGKTPADEAGIQIKGQNKWLTMIQNASFTGNDAANVIKRKQTQ
jgi:hypothetical protein